MYICQTLSNQQVNGVYQCLQWVQDSGQHITPEVAGIIIGYALLINIVSLGIRSMKQSF